MGLGISKTYFKDNYAQSKKGLKMQQEQWKFDQLIKNFLDTSY